MLSVAESASLLGVSPSRVRALIAEGALPAEKIGRSWVLREEDVLQRAANRPGPRPTRKQSPPVQASSSIPRPSLPTSEIDLHDLYLACKKAFAVRPDAEAIAEPKALTSRVSILPSPTISFSNGSANSYVRGCTDGRPPLVHRVRRRQWIGKIHPVPHEPLAHTGHADIDAPSQSRRIAERERRQRIKRTRPDPSRKRRWR